MLHSQVVNRSFLTQRFFYFRFLKKHRTKDYKVAEPKADETCSAEDTEDTADTADTADTGDTPDTGESQEEEPPAETPVSEEEVEEEDEDPAAATTKIERNKFWKGKRYLTMGTFLQESWRDYFLGVSPTDLYIGGRTLKCNTSKCDGLIFSLSFVSIGKVSLKVVVLRWTSIIWNMKDL